MGVISTFTTFGNLIGKVLGFTQYLCNGECVEQTPAFYKRLAFGCYPFYPTYGTISVQ